MPWWKEMRCLGWSRRHVGNMGQKHSYKETFICWLWGNGIEALGKVPGTFSRDDALSLMRCCLLLQNIGREGYAGTQVTCLDFSWPFLAQF